MSAAAPDPASLSSFEYTSGSIRQSVLAAAPEHSLQTVQQANGQDHPAPALGTRSAKKLLILKV
jgi:hypothetical protein